MSWLKRWRNSHGFGVHSPFGFMITQNVISLPDKYNYYAEKSLREGAKLLPLSHSLQKKAARLACVMLRLAVSSPFKVALISEESDRQNPLLAQAFKAAGVQTRVLNRKELSQALAKIKVQNTPTMLVVDSGNPLPTDDLIQHLTACGNHLLFLGEPHPLAQRILQLPNQLIFEGKDNLFAIARPHMQSLRYYTNI